ncbi:MAG TPA: UbiA family prenyltransferase [Candidatus Eremiobacteraceae bacterium]|nr:UbiA family prenyltransferase [Candidatus Eremiobacteraceae bacterium]
MALLALAKPAKLYRLLASAGLGVLVVLPLTALQWPRVVLALVGGIAAAAAGNALNMYFERDLDASCASTRSRPLVTGAVTPASALVFSAALLTCASVLLLLAGIAVTIVTLLAVIVYAIVYTRLIKPVTPYHTILGGAVWGAPVLAIWAASGKPFSPVPILIFLLVACWTTLHTWSIALTESSLRYPAAVPVLIRARGPAYVRAMLFVVVLALATITALLRQWPALCASVALVAVAAIAYGARAAWSDRLLSRASLVYIGAFVIFTAARLMHKL